MTKKIFKSTMVVSAVVMALGLAFVLGILYQYFDRQLNKELAKEAAYLKRGVELEGIDYLTGIQAKDSRITYISEDGTVLYDSQAEASEMENHGERKEIQEAQKKGHGKDTRISQTLAEKTIYYAIRLQDGNYLRVSSTQYSILALIFQLIQPVLWILLVMMILSGIMASMLSKSIVQPINNLDLENPEENEIYEEIDPLLSRIYRQNRMIQSLVKEARQQQEEFAIITENMKEGLLVLDKYTMILSGNASVWKMFRMLVPKTGESVYSLNRSEEFRAVIERVLTGEHHSAILDLNGAKIQIISNPVFREQKVEGAVLLLMNVTEKVERENLRREFSANVSHELKTPLTSISGFAEIIQAGLVRPEDVTKFAGKIYKEAQRLISLIEDVIRVSQLDEKEIPYEWCEVDVYQAAKSVFETLSEAARKKQVDLYIEGEHMSICTVAPIFEEVLYNICDNAIKYNHADGNACIYLSQTEETVTIRVKDTGMGIPKEDQIRVFERFYRVDKSHSKEIGGTGLGLSIVKHGVSFLGGKLRLESELNIGTEIILIFEKNIKNI